MTTFYEQFKTDEKAESDIGIVLDYGSAGKIRIHRAGGANQAYRNLLQASLKPYTRQMQTGTMDEKVARDLMVRIYAKTVIVGWENVKNEKGKVLEYNTENVVKLMTDLPDLFDDIQRAAQDHSLFRATIEDEVSGN